MKTAGETFSYSIIGGADAASFSIGGAGSDELILTDGVLDFETQSSYSVIVRVTDSGGNTYDETLTVNVNDLNETPTDIAPNSFAVDENTDTSSGFSLGTLTATDEDGGENVQLLDHRWCRCSQFLDRWSRIATN